MIGTARHAATAMIMPTLRLLVDFLFIWLPLPIGLIGFAYSEYFDKFSSLLKYRYRHKPLYVIESGRLGVL
jgi:hypothetical protein